MGLIKSYIVKNRKDSIKAVTAVDMEREQIQPRILGIPRLRPSQPFPDGPSWGKEAGSKGHGKIWSAFSSGLLVANQATLCS